jgi:hypothetical protein
MRSFFKPYIQPAATGERGRPAGSGGKARGGKTKKSSTIGSEQQYNREAYGFGNTRSESLAQANPEELEIECPWSGDIELQNHLNRALEEITDQLRQGVEQIPAFGDVQPYPIQWAVMRLFIQYFNEGVFAARMPMGSGKTLVAALIAYYSSAALIVVNGVEAIRNEWIPQLARFGLFHIDPRHSSILVYDKANAREHYDYVNALIMKTLGIYSMENKFDANYMVNPSHKLRIVVNNSDAKSIVKGIGGDSATSLERGLQALYACGFGSYHVLNGENVMLPDNRITVIVDEAAKEYRVLVREVQQRMNLTRANVSLDVKLSTPYIGKEFLMSGSRIDDRNNGFSKRDHPALIDGRPNFGFHIDVHLLSKFTADAPTVNWTIKRLDTGGPGQPSNGPNPWFTELNAFVTAHQKVFMFCDNKQYESFGNNRVFGNKTWLKMTGNKDAIDEFNNSTGVVLGISSTGKVEGYNLNGDSVVIIMSSADTNYAPSMDRIQQTVNRIVRPGSSYKTVDALILCGSYAEVMRAYYAKAFSYVPWDFVIDSGDIIYDGVAKSTSLANLLGLQLKSLDIADLCVLLADYIKLYDSNYEPREIIIWWFKQHQERGTVSALTPSLIIKDLFWPASPLEKEEAFQTYDYLAAGGQLVLGSGGWRVPLPGEAVPAALPAALPAAAAPPAANYIKLPGIEYDYFTDMGNGVVADLNGQYYNYYFVEGDPTAQMEPVTAEQAAAITAAAAAAAPAVEPTPAAELAPIETVTEAAPAAALAPTATEAVGEPPIVRFNDIDMDFYDLGQGFYQDAAGNVYNIQDGQLALYQAALPQ